MTLYIIIAGYAILIGSAYYYAYIVPPEYGDDAGAETTAHWDAGDYPTTRERGEDD